MLSIILTTFAIIFPAELPDKSMITAIILGAKYKPAHVFAGIATAFAAQVGIAVIAGQLLGRLPHRWLELIVGVLFGIGAILIIREHGGDTEATELIHKQADQPPFWKVGGIAFIAIFAAEFGDLTQIATANLVAKFHDPLSVGIGSVLALWSVGAIGVWGGKNLHRLIPIVWFIRVAAAILAILAITSFIAAARA